MGSGLILMVSLLTGLKLKYALQCKKVWEGKGGVLYNIAHSCGCRRHRIRWVGGCSLAPRYGGREAGMGVGMCLRVYACVCVG